MRRNTLSRYFEAMTDHYGPTHWWPGETPFEIAIGAILTQNTAWANVEKAIAALKEAHLLSPEAMLACSPENLEQAVRPSGYYRQKAKRLRIFCQHLMDHYDGDVALMAQRPAGELREELLSLHGIGPETADDMLLYACDKPVFVVDAYTLRIFSRHGLVDSKIAYEPLRAFFEHTLPGDVPLFKEYHGLIVWTGKDFCKKTPQCDGCPLARLLKKGQPVLE